ncbi:hypothetical protein [Sinorhizobium meliloti]|uniref:hypothetical protein n=1 Tax=Rhizobium meliloti TaxID=382 RepID=UPI0012A93637|nr:hypothetical protein [Sinorhizobium meliloti]QGJ74710.1 hypothetical protein C3L21_12385 [Sinorhizobium meliloti]
MSDRGFCVTVTSALALIAFVFVMRFLPDFLAWKGWPACGPEDCNIQSWLSALSGWVAAGAAFITIRYINKQIAEQRKQTDFQLGDAKPTLDCVQDLEDPEELVLRLVNWNRRSVIIKTIEIDDPTITLGIMDFKKNGETENLSSTAAPYIRGWENRNSAPETAQIKISAARDEKIVREWPDNLRISMRIHMIGDVHQEEKLHCFLPQRNT